MLGAFFPYAGSFPKNGSCGEMAFLILACGSRGWTDRLAIRGALERYIPPSTQWSMPTVLHGAATGADVIAGAEALDLGFVVEEMRANWRRDGSTAGFKRNLAMLDRRPDVVLAFWDGRSNGTAHTIRNAQQRGISVLTFLEPNL